MPVVTRINTFEIKYGITISPIPLINGIIAFCFFPYIKNPSPIDPKITPHINVDVFISIPSSHNVLHQLPALELRLYLAEDTALNLQEKSAARYGATECAGSAVFAV